MRMCDVYIYPSNSPRYVYSLWVEGTDESEIHIFDREGKAVLYGEVITNRNFSELWNLLSSKQETIISLELPNYEVLLTL